MNFLQRIIQRLFDQKPPIRPEQIGTAPLHVEGERPDWSTNGLDTILVGTAQSAGIERPQNEDALLIMLGNTISQRGVPEFGLFLVADGMGGHRAGEVASAISVRTVARCLTEKTILHLFEIDPPDDIPPLQDLLREALETANQTVVARVPGGGTTMTAAVLLGSQITIGHVGDSRAYVFSDGATQVVTRDHSLVERLRELGQLTEDEAATHPQRNVLYRAIGQGANLEVDVSTIPVPYDGHLLICSDGLWSVISEGEIERIVGDALHPQEACDELVRAANAAGGPDNITAVLIRFPPR
jgi:protein phosphatase